MGDRARHQQLMSLFNALCSLPPSIQRERIASLRKANAGLADTLAAMLAGDEADSPLDAGAASLTPQSLTLPPRYADRGPLGAGGMGEVRRVFDTELNRTVAMKIIAQTSPALEARFMAEAQVVAQLQHPGIVPVHALGRLPDGRVYFTMPEVRGHTWAQALAERAEDAAARRDAVYVLRQVAQAVAYAHEQGVVHRDLKPGNVMIGPFGDVLVLDWGLARRLEESALLPAAVGVVTSGGTIMGTPGYMAPEQAMGLVQEIGPHTDVYALGAMLYHVLAGRPPFGPTPDPAAMVAGPPPLPGDAPPPLAELCLRAMAPMAADRPPHAGAFAAALSAWLSGAADRARAEGLLSDAEADRDAARAGHARAARLEAAAMARLAAVPNHAPLEEKEGGWALEDAAAAEVRAARAAEARWLRQVHSALTLAPDLEAAHRLLAEHYRAAAEAAEARGDEATASVHREAVAHHDDGTHRGWLEGTASLHVTSSPPGAVAGLWTWHVRGRRKTLERLEILGGTPVGRDALPAGDYMIRLTASGRPPVDCPIQLRREGAHQRHVVVPERLPPETCYVPAGSCAIGGDPAAPDSFPRTEVFVPGFALARRPVTNAEFIAFLDHLVAEDREEEALASCPREPTGGVTGPVYGRRGHGFVVGEDAEGVPWDLDEPVVQITWRAAMAYCAWLAERTGIAWRLPHEVEWEKAARGTDGRAWPWGDHFDPAFARTLGSRQGPPRREPVAGSPTDVSPYGVRGLGGNVRDWCLNTWRAEPPPPVLRIEAPDTDDPGLRAVRGGSYVSLAALCRAATRFAAPPDQHFVGVGFRVACTWPPDILSP